jgi:hypothetical protein
MNKSECQVRRRILSFLPDGELNSSPQLANEGRHRRTDCVAMPLIAEMFQ